MTIFVAVMNEEMHFISVTHLWDPRDPGGVPDWLLFGDPEWWLAGDPDSAPGLFGGDPLWAGLPEPTGLPTGVSEWWLPGLSLPLAGDPWLSAIQKIWWKLKCIWQSMAEIVWRNFNETKWMTDISLQVVIWDLILDHNTSKTMKKKYWSYLASGLKRIALKVPLFLPPYKCIYWQDWNSKAFKGHQFELTYVSLLKDHKHAKTERFIQHRKPFKECKQS